MIINASDDVTPVVHSGFQEVFKQEEGPPHAQPRSFLGRLLDRINLGPQYLSTLTEGQILARALTPREIAEHLASERGRESALRDLLARADAHVARLGESYRQRIYSDAVKQTVSG